MSVRVEERDRERPVCPYCKGEVVDGSATWACPACSTVHHLDCARANDRCTVLGCQGLAPRAPSGLAHRRTTSASPAATIALGVVLVSTGLGLFWLVARPTYSAPTPPPVLRDMYGQPVDRRTLDLFEEAARRVMEVVELDLRHEPADEPFNAAVESYRTLSASKRYSSLDLELFCGGTVARRDTERRAAIKAVIEELRRGQRRGR